jgi:hypothetical protein
MWPFSGYRECSAAVMQYRLCRFGACKHLYYVRNAHQEEPRSEQNALKARISSQLNPPKRLDFLAYDISVSEKIVTQIPPPAAANGAP